MPNFELLTLDLRSPIAYPGLENPPLTGAPLSGSAILPSVSGKLVELGLGSDMAEGEEELFLFDEEELVGYDPDEGPSLRRQLPRPRFYGRRAAGRAPSASGEPPERDAASKLGSEARLPPGGYAFLQWRPRNEAELLEGLEWFAKESWWERTGAVGPYMLRRIFEDGKLATQALRRMPGGDQTGREPSR
jgi:hypothetical protein